MSSRRAPDEMSVREAANRYLRRRRADATEATVKSWKYRLKLFVEWCDGIGLDHVGELRGYDIDEYYEIRSAKVAPATLEGEMWTMRMFAEYLEQIDAVEDGLSDSVRIPDINPEDRADETKLSTPAAMRLIEHYRDSEQDRASRAHAFLELAWFTGARQSGLRALDVRDLNARFDADEQSWVEFRHRPDTETPLKNNRRGERPVGIPDEVAKVVSEYVRESRYDVRDDHGRKPLIASAEGRPTENTVREHGPSVELRGDAAVRRRWLSARQGPGYLRLDEVREAEQVSVVEIAAPDTDGVDHVATEPGDPAGGSRGAGRRDGENDRESLRLGLDGGPVAAVPRPNGTAAGLRRAADGKRGFRT